MSDFSEEDKALFEALAKHLDAANVIVSILMGRSEATRPALSSVYAKIAGASDTVEEMYLDD